MNRTWLSESWGGGASSDSSRILFRRGLGKVVKLAVKAGSCLDPDFAQ